MSTILAPTDFSDKSAHALRTAAYHAMQRGSRLCCMHVVEELDEGSSWLLLVEPPEQIEQDVVKAREEKLKEFVTRHVPPKFPRERLDYRVVVGSAIDEVLLASEELAVDLIVVGTVGHGVVMAAFLGSTANQLVRQSERPVLIVPPAEEVTVEFRHILAPIDQSDASHKSLRIAAALAKSSGGQVTALHAMNATLAGAGDPGFPVYIGPGTLESLGQDRQLWMDNLVKDLDIGQLVKDTVISYEDPATAIDEFAEAHGVDLICMGTHGRRGVRRFLLGNTAERVLRKVPCAVMVIPI